MDVVVPSPPPRSPSDGLRFLNAFASLPLTQTNLSSHHADPDSLRIPLDGQKLAFAPDFISRAVRENSVATHTFSSLTPIIGSPLTTPSHSVSSGRSDTESDTEEEADPDGGGEKDTPPFAPPKDAMYMHASRSGPLPRRTDGLMEPTPTWKATPPTPPAKPPPVSTSPSDPHAAARVNVGPSHSLPDASFARDPDRSAILARRRMSLPLMHSLSKPLPPTPPPVPPPGTKLQTPRRVSPLRPSAEPSTSPLSRHRSSGSKSSKTKFIFHVAPDESDKDDDLEDESRYQSAVEGEETASERELDVHEKENLRRYHVLHELLSTEVGYLMDLRRLVTAYIRRLPTLALPASATPTPFGSSSNISALSPFNRSSSSTSFRASTFGPSRSGPHAQMPTFALSLPSSPVNAQFPRSTPKRYIISEREVDVITRNIEDILQFHEAFVGDLRRIVSPLGFGAVFEPMGLGFGGGTTQKSEALALESIDAAVDAVAKQFAEQVPQFSLYESFCSGHSEAHDLVKRIQKEHPESWALFERRASEQTLGTLREAVVRRGSGDEGASKAKDVSPEEPQECASPREAFEGKRKRRHSLSSLDPELMSRHSAGNMAAAAAQDSPADAPTQSLHHVLNSRLHFHDYLIKPVQRICRYPMILDHLQSRKPKPIMTTTNTYTDVNADEDGEASGVNAPADALRAMKRVAGCVDEARRRHDVASKSALIAARIEQASVPLTPAFLSSLGACLLATSLVVVTTGAGSAVDVHFCGAFLYMGGYLVLVKVGRGRKYKPRHWFSLVGWRVESLSEEDALLPHSFCLTCQSNRFELAAACRSEKDIWLSSIEEARRVPPAWENEPPSSLNAQNAPEASEEAETREETIPTLPTIHSLPELDFDVFLDPQTHRPARKRRNSKAAEAVARPAFRRSSTASAKSILLAAPSDRFRPLSPATIARKELDLEDVLSEVCLSTRSQAQAHGEELFPAATALPKVSRSHSAMSMAVKLTRKKTYGTDDGEHGAPRSPSKNARRRNLSLKPRRPRGGQPAGDATAQPLTSATADALVDHVPEASQCSSDIGSGTSPSIQVHGLSSAPPFAADSGTGVDPDQALASVRARPQRTRSMIDNVRGFFHPAGGSPTSSVYGTVKDPSYSTSELPSINNPNPSPAFRRWIFGGSLRRRVRSAPDVPSDEGTPPLPASDSQQSIQDLPTPKSSQRASKPPTPPIRRHSLFSEGTLRRRTQSDDRTVASVARRSQTSLSLFQRLSPLSVKDSI